MRCVATWLIFSPSSRRKISWLGIELPTTPFGFGHLSTNIQYFRVILDHFHEILDIYDTQTSRLAPYD